MPTCRPRYIPTGSVVLCTSRTIDGRHNFAPDDERFVAECIGVVAKAQQSHDVELHAVALMSNHLHILMTSPGTAVVSKFMEFVGCNLSKTANRHRGRRGPVWDGPYHHTILSTEEEVQLAMLAYVLAHGAKEGIVDLPEAWPGLTSAVELNPRESKPLLGIWEDRTRICRTTAANAEAHPEKFESVVRINHTLPPALAHSEPDAARAAVGKATDKLIDEQQPDRRNRLDEPRRAIIKPWTHTTPLDDDADDEPHGAGRYAANDGKSRAKLQAEYRLVCERYAEASLAHSRGERFEYPAETHPRRLSCAPNAVLSAVGGAVGWAAAA